ncbi:WD40 repeat-like protein [Trametes cingulata]|nr:WD40 repeat-like protein [Trametes cingulata]
MAAAITTTSLTILEHPSLKHPPSTAEPTCLLASPSSSVVWSAESGTVFVASADGSLSQYDVASKSLQDLNVSARSSPEPIVSLLYKDRGSTVIYGQGQQVVVLSTTTGKPSNTFDTHKAPITSLSLSNDSSLLASTSAHAIHVHNLTLASHTVLRGIPVGGAITSSAFHPHSRTRLLVGLGSQLLVYDTTRPSGPAKVVEVDKEKKNLGPIVAISCSPFSKTLVAVACSGGTVALIDLEKEKGLFRVVTMPAPITCLSFSAEGAAVYAGTENGKFLLLDLRALDKPPKSITVSENGDRVVALCVQKKLKPGEAQAKPASSTAAASKPLVQRDVNKAPTTTRTSGTSDPVKKPTDSGKAPLKTARARAASGTASTTGTTTTPRRTAMRTASSSSQVNAPAARVASGSRPVNRTGPKSPVVTRPSATEAQRRAFSPPKTAVGAENKDEEADSGDLSVRIENLLALPKAKEPKLPATVEEALSAVAASRAPSVLSRASSRAQVNEGPRARAHSRAESVSQASTGESISAAGPRLRSGSSASTTGRASKASVRSALGASSTSPARGQPRRVSSSTVSRSRTPSPDLPDMDDAGPVTPIPAYKMKGKERAGAGAAVLGLGTPEVEEWVKAGEGRDVPREGRRVGFADQSDDEDDDAERVRPQSRMSDSEDEGEDARDDRDHRQSASQRPLPELAMQISPRRSFPGPSNSSRWAPVPSPLRNPAPPHGGGGGGVPASPQARAAQDMLQALLRDALHDFRAETKAEIVGLHLDLIRMGSSWRREMQEAVGGLGEELRALREENARLREENERLRRGY